MSDGSPEEDEGEPVAPVDEGEGRQGRLQPVAAAAEARRRPGGRGGLVDGLGVNQRTKRRGAPRKAAARSSCSRGAATKRTMRRTG